MSPFDALKRFFSSKVDGHAPMDDAFVQIDREGRIDALKLRERGEEQGTMNLPRTDASTLDVVEHEVAERVGEELNAAQIAARNNTQSYENRLAALQLLHELGAIQAATTTAIGDFETLVIDWRNRLSNRRDAIVESYHDLQKFKRDNELSRPTFEIPPKIVTVGSIALAGLVEVIGNAIFLRVNDDLGYLGGIVAAIMVAAVNVGVATAVGYFFWPKTSLRAGLHKQLGWTVIGLWLALVLVWNLLAAHYRDAKSDGLEDAQAAAGRLLLSQPFSLDGIYSWGLFIIGVVAALVAARAAYKMDDPYPGYGERGRQHRQRCEEYAEEVASANRELTGVRNDAIKDAQDVKQQLGTQLRERHRIQGAYSRFAARFAQHQDHLEQTANYLLSVYRDANRRARSDQEPKYFSDRFIWTRSTLEPLQSEQVREGDVKAAENALTRCISDVDAAFRESIRSFEPLDKLKAELERGTV